MSKQTCPAVIVTLLSNDLPVSCNSTLFFSCISAIYVIKQWLQYKLWWISKYQYLNEWQILRHKSLGKPWLDSIDLCLARENVLNEISHLEFVFAFLNSSCTSRIPLVVVVTVIPRFPKWKFPDYDCSCYFTNELTCCAKMIFFSLRSRVNCSISWLHAHWYRSTFELTSKKNNDSQSCWSRHPPHSAFSVALSRFRCQSFALHMHWECLRLMNSIGLLINILHIQKIPLAIERYSWEVSRPNHCFELQFKCTKRELNQLTSFSRVLRKNSTTNGSFQVEKNPASVAEIETKIPPEFDSKIVSREIIVWLWEWFDRKDESLI